MATPFAPLTTLTPSSVPITPIIPSPVLSSLIEWSPFLLPHSWQLLNAAANTSISATAGTRGN